MTNQNQPLEEKITLVDEHGGAFRIDVNDHKLVRKGNAVRYDDGLYIYNENMNVYFFVGTLRTVTAVVRDRT